MTNRTLHNKILRHSIDATTHGNSGAFITESDPLYVTGAYAAVVGMCVMVLVFFVAGVF